MNGELDVLVDKVGDPALRAALRDRIERIEDRRSYGLVFEEHLPERVCLPDHPIRVGSKVALRSDAAGPNFVVTAVAKGKATLAQTRHPDGSGLTDDEAQASKPTTVKVGDLVVVAEFGDPIYPGMRVLGSVELGGDKPHHVVIKGDNHHVLEALQFTHAGRVDVIYIDPPYNTGDGDWMYDNNYVDKTDRYQHSKWLAFMERRLKLAGDLLKPDGVLVVTIDEHEVHRLRMLLEQTFPTAYVQMVTIVVNPKGVAQGRFARVEEYAVYCFFGSSAVEATDDDYLSDSATQRNTRFWKGLLRAGTNALPADGLGAVYPVFIDPGSKRIVGTGKTLKERLADGEASGDPNAWVPPGDEGAPAGCVAVWPVRNDQKLGVWQAVPATLLQLRDQGYTRCAQRGTSWALSYVPTGVRRKIESGEVVVSGADPVSGSAKLARTRDLTRAKTVWKRARHDAGWHGAVVLRDMLGDRVFDFPKSIYAVRDALQPLLCNRPDALVLDFFAGSGTTTHSICLMNQADGGRRSTILVTNNELSKSDANELAESGLTVGSPEWDGRGIFERVTRPRVSAAITGQRPDGSYVELEYEDGSLASEGFPENVTFAELTFEDPNRVELDLSFEAVAPLLWMRAGAAGPVIAERGDDDQAYAITEHYGVLFDSDRWRSFIADLTDSVRTVFIVTDSAATFSQVSAELPTGVDAVRLYENYLTTFRYGGQGT